MPSCWSGAQILLRRHLHKSTDLKPNSKLLWPKIASSLFELLLAERGCLWRVTPPPHATPVQIRWSCAYFCTGFSWRGRLARQLAPAPHLIYLNEVPAEGTRREVPDISAACSFGYIPGRATVRFVLALCGCFVSSAWLFGEWTQRHKLQTLPANFRHERQRRGCGRIPCCVSFIESFLTLIEYRITVQLLRLGAGLSVLAQFRRLFTNLWRWT